jgi:KTSC domain-containing protein
MDRILRRLVEGSIFLTMPSTVIRSYSYDAASEALSVVFQSGRRYTCEAVPAETFQAMKAAFSKGEFFSTHLRGRFRIARNSAPAT